MSVPSLFMSDRMAFDEGMQAPFSREMLFNRLGNHEWVLGQNLKGSSPIVNKRNPYKK